MASKNILYIEVLKLHLLAFYHVVKEVLNACNTELETESHEIQIRSLHILSGSIYALLFIKIIYLRINFYNKLIKNFNFKVLYLQTDRRWEVSTEKHIVGIK